MRRGSFAALLLLAVGLMPLPPAQALPPAHCEGLFYGIESTCMFSAGGSVVFEVYGMGYRSENPQAQIEVTVWKLPVSPEDTPLARCSTEGGVLRVCLSLPSGTGLPPNSVLLCKITGVADYGAYGCATP